MTYQRTLDTQKIKLATLYVHNILDILKYLYMYFITLKIPY